MWLKTVSLEDGLWAKIEQNWTRKISIYLFKTSKQLYIGRNVVDRMLLMLLLRFTALWQAAVEISLQQSTWTTSNWKCYPASHLAPFKVDILFFHSSPTMLSALFLQPSETVWIAHGCLGNRGPGEDGELIREKLLVSNQTRCLVCLQWAHPPSFSLWPGGKIRGVNISICNWRKKSKTKENVSQRKWCYTVSAPETELYLQILCSFVSLLALQQELNVEFTQYFLYSLWLGLQPEASSALWLDELMKQKNAS